MFWVFTIVALGSIFVSCKAIQRSSKNLLPCHFPKLFSTPQKNLLRLLFALQWVTENCAARFASPLRLRLNLQTHGQRRKVLNLVRWARPCMKSLSKLIAPMLAGSTTSQMKTFLALHFSGAFLFPLKSLSCPQIQRHGAKWTTTRNANIFWYWATKWR